MRLALFGSGAFGLPTFRSLATSHEIVGVVTQPDRPAGRGGRLTPTPVGAWAADALPVTPLLKPGNANEHAAVHTVHEWRADAWVVIAFGQKLSKQLLAHHAAFNLHASLLPRWRGAAPINWAMLAGDAATGNSVIALADRMDAGEVFAQSTRAIEPTRTAGELHDALADDGPAVMEEALRAHASGGARGRTQDELKVTLAPKLSRADGWVNFNEPAELCRRRINALSPWPGVTVRFRGEPLKLVRAAAESMNAPAHAGHGAIVTPPEGLVACGDGRLLRLLDVQPAGGREMAWRDFANGRRVGADEEERLFGGIAC